MIPALNIENVSKFYGKEQAVKNISLSVLPGEFFGLLGPNGAGKSTTINMIGGVSKISSGKIQVFGHDVEKEYLKSRRRTGVMHQEILLDVFLNIKKSISLFSGYYGVKRDKEWINSLIDRLALRPHLTKQPNKLSGGTKRRFMILKALIHKPSLLILDEPTAGVDVELRHTLWEFLRYINKQGTTILLTTHYLEEAEDMCERVAIMDHGKIVAMEKKEKLLEVIGEKKMIIHLEKPMEKIPGILISENPKLSDNKKELIFQISHEHPIKSIIEKIVHANINYSEIKTKKANLEEVFLKFTNGKNNAL